MKLKKLLSLILALTMALALFGCGSRGSSGGDTASEDQTWTFTIAHTDSEARSVHIAATEFAEYMADKTDGRFQVRVSANGELGDDEELMKAVQLGTINMYIGYNGIVAGLLGDTLEMFELPFLFDDGDHMLRTYANGGLDLYNSQLEGTGYYCAGVGYEGARSIMSTKGVIDSLDDIQGMKIRCGNVQTYIDYYEAIGAAPTAIQFGEVYTSLTQGVIDAVDQVVTIFEDQKYTEAAKYCTIDNHFISPCCYVISESFLDTLPDDIREIFLEGVQIMCDRQTEIDGGNEKDLPNTTWKEKGVETYYMTEELRQEFKAETEFLYSAYEEKHPDLYEAAMALVEENRAES